MTIIEAALEKTKQMRGQRPPAGVVQPTAIQAPAPSHASAAYSRRIIEPGVLPATQLQAQRVQFDPQRARENRLLLSSAVPEDRGTVAAYGMLRTRILHRARSKD